MIALVGCAGLPEGAPAVRALLDRAAPGSVVRYGGCVVAAIGTAAHPADDSVLSVTDGDRRCGAVLGRVFEGSRRRTQPVPLGWLRADRALTDRVWGRYVALTGTPEGELVIARDPLGLLPCYVAGSGSGVVASTSMAVLIDVTGEQPAFDWEFLTSFIRQGLCPTERTAFQGIRQVLAGTVLSAGGKAPVSRTAWNAAEIAARPARPDAGHVRQVLAECGRAWSTDATASVVDLSGGLDSATVCWAAAQGDPPVQARFLHFPDGPTVDERDFAAAVADRLRVPLEVVEAGELLPGGTASHAPRTDAPQLQLVEARLDQALGELTPAGAVVMCGGAGDEVFISAVAPDAAADLLVEHGRRYGPRGALAQAWSGGTRGRLRTAARAAALWYGQRRGGTPAQASLAFPPPAWLDATGPPLPPAVPAGTWALRTLKARQVLGITYWAGSVDREHRSRPRPMVYPLLSQPLVEVALRAPVAELVGHRGDRLPIRDAMAGVLPASVVERRGKGSYLGVYRRGLYEVADSVCDLLTGGIAAGAGLLDRQALRADVWATARGQRQGPNWPLFSLLAVETWCQAWTRRHTARQPERSAT